MKNVNLDEQIRERFSQEAGQVPVPDDMREEIARRLKSAEVMHGATGTVQKLSGGKTGRLCFRKRSVMVLAVVLVVAIGAFAGMKKMETKGTYGYGSIFPVSRDIKDFPAIAKSAGYPCVKMVETFSNGYTYKGVWVTTNQKYDEQLQKMTKSYKVMDMEYLLPEHAKIDISIAPASMCDLEKYETSKRTEAIYDWDGVRVYQVRYVHLMLPEKTEDWRDELTEEQLQMVEDGIASVNGPSDTPETCQYDFHVFTWQQGDYVYHVSASYHFASVVTTEELQTVARELMEANRLTIGEKIGQFLSNLFH